MSFYVGGRKLSKLLESGARKAIALKIRESLNPQTVCMIFVAAAFEVFGVTLVVFACSLGLCRLWGGSLGTIVSNGISSPKGV